MNRMYRKTGLVAVLAMALIMSPVCAMSIEGSTTVQPIAVRKRLYELYRQ